jgi:pyruvate dehydrogenase complex dehydrogenase (E1) component
MSRWHETLLLYKEGKTADSGRRITAGSTLVHAAGSLRDARDQHDRFIYYSMFGFQRIEIYLGGCGHADAWILLGGPWANDAFRRILQHQDGNHVLALPVPNGGVRSGVCIRMR